MTTLDRAAFHAPARRDAVLVAGVQWPRYKLVALAFGAAVLVIVGLLTMSAAPAVLSGAAATTLVWAALAGSRRTGH